jgi:hypothetical protein
MRSSCRTTPRLLPSALGSMPSSRRLRTSRRRPPLPIAASRPPASSRSPRPPHLGADSYCCPSARAIFAFIGIFPGRGLVARPHRLFDLQRHGHRRTSTSGDRIAQRPLAAEHHPRLLHQLCQLVWSHGAGSTALRPALTRYRRYSVPWSRVDSDG